MLRGSFFRSRCYNAFVQRFEAFSEVRIPPEEVRRFIIDCMQTAGAPKHHATSLASVLVAADHRGHFSHGLNRLEMYINDIRSGITAVDAEPAILSETVSVALVDGKNLLGTVVGEFCMNLAIEKAKKTGIAFISAKGSNHYGIAGWYSMMASKKGLVGISMTSTSPLMFPTRAQELCVGTNPLSVAAPGASPDDEFVLDMATTAVALGKVEMNRRKKIPLPSGWAADKRGEVTSVPEEVLDGGGLLPLGGVEMTGGYKGYGLAMLVEVLCGILSGATYGKHIRRWMNTSQVANLGQCFAAIDPAAFGPGFQERLSAFSSDLRGLKPVREDPVLIPGDPERARIALCEREGGITYHPNLIKSMNDLAEEMKVTPMKTLSS